MVSHNELGPIERYIEVKSIGGIWGDRGVGLTATQYEFAREKGSLFWLYVVERATSDEPTLYEIQDPAALIDEYRFDGGWTEVALGESAFSASPERTAWYTEYRSEALNPGVSQVPVFSDPEDLGQSLEGAGSFGSGTWAVEEDRLDGTATYLLFTDQTPADPTGETVLARVSGDWQVGAYILIVDESDGSLRVVIRPLGQTSGQGLEEFSEDDVDVYATFVGEIAAGPTGEGR